ncbi:14093_t:CDS:2 [Funneliformis geosporum]|uniref:2293_t:CDS:1 n=1 Tax=Funneliformis geosporum TaxID=1117311 RepID=A0A9W4SGA3_9GLOM|nr:14093_t:CDS:2 [Funneliformis geosporum]CAI2167326.1 2293_t:CDS:2 [Funneliformis geosporum]
MSSLSSLINKEYDKKKFEFVSQHLYNEVYRESLHVNSKLKEELQESNDQFEKLQRHALNSEKQKLEESQRLKQLQKSDEQLEKYQLHVLKLEKQKLEESQRFKQLHENLQEKNREITRINSELNVRLQESDEQLEKFQRYVLNLEQQKIEIKKIVSQNLEKTIINENDNGIKKINTPLISEGNEQKDSFLINNNSHKLAKQIEHSWSLNDHACIRIVIGLDFGISYTGFAYCHVSSNEDIISHNSWPGTLGQLKTDAVLQYDDVYDNVILWGFPALTKRSYGQNGGRDNKTKPVQLFNSHLSNLPDKLKPKLQIEYIKAMTDYLREIGIVMKETISTRYPGINFLSNILLVVTCPEEYSDNAKVIMRECAFKAGLIKDKCSRKLQLITEAEAAAIYCIFREHDLNKVGTPFMVVDCDETVNLTIFKLNNEKKVDLVTKKSYKCGNTFINSEFIKYLRKKLGDRPLNLLSDNYYVQMQYLIREFSRRCILPFTGAEKDFTYELDIDETIPIVKRYISDESRKYLESIEWTIELGSNDIKSIFDPFIKNLIQLIHTELDRSRYMCSELFLIGSFGESKYLQNSMNISVPTRTIVATAQGAVKYGLYNLNC